MNTSNYTKPYYNVTHNKVLILLFSSLFFNQFLFPQLFWHCFPVTIIPLSQNTGSCYFPDHDFSILYCYDSPQLVMILSSASLLGYFIYFASFIPLLSLLLCF